MALAVLGLLPATRAWGAEPAAPAPAASTSGESGPSLSQHESRRRSFEQAMRAMEEEHWQEARELFAQLWAEKESYDVALNLGLAEYNLAHYREAAEDLAYGLENLPPREKAETAARAQQVLGLCEERLGMVDLVVANEGAAVLVDGRSVPASARVAGLFVAPGSHAFEVRLDGFEPEKWSLSLGAGERQSRSVTLLPERYRAGSRRAADSGGAESGSGALNPVEARPWHQGWTPVVAGGAVALLGASMGLAFEVMRGSKAEEADDLRAKVGDEGCADAASRSTDCAALHDANSSYDSISRYEVGSFVVAGLALAGTVTYFLVARPDKPRAASSAVEPWWRVGARVAPRGSELLIEGTF